MNELEKCIEELEHMLTYLRENRPGLSLDNLRLAISLLKKSNAKPSVTDKTKKVVTCRTCGAYRIDKCTCCDCVNSFTNPFDELFCHLHNSTNKICKDFKKREGITKN